MLRLYDEAIGGSGSQPMMDLIDGSAMLWRLHLRGVALGDRFDAIAERWAEASAAGEYAFSDLHAMIAFVGADRPQQQRAVIDGLEAALQRDVDKAAFTRDVGLPAILAILAFGNGDYARATDLLRAIRSGRTASVAATRSVI